MFLVELSRLAATVIGYVVLLMWLLGALGFADFALLFWMR